MNLRSVSGALALAATICTVLHGAATSPPAPLDAARQLFAAGDYSGARAAFTQLAGAEPGNAEARFYLGWTAFRLHEPEEAVKWLERATALDTTKSLYFHVLGDAYGLSAQRASLFSKLGLAKKCLAAYDRGVAVDPDNVEVRTARYRFFRAAPGFAGGGAEKAAAELEEIRRRDLSQALVLLEEPYLGEKKFDRAFAVVEDLLRREPDNATAWYHLGRLAAVTGQQLDRGDAALRRYLLHVPVGREPPLCSAHWRLGMICEVRGDRSAARVEYETALQLAPDFSPAKDALRKLP